MRDDLTPIEIQRIEQALKRLPYFDPSPGFEDRVMARVSRFQHRYAPAVLSERRVAARPRVAPMPELETATERQPVRWAESLPVRAAAVAMVASAVFTLTAIGLFAFLQLETFLFVVGAFGEGALGYLAMVSAQVAGAVIGESAAAYVAAAGPGAVAATAGAFGTGAVAGLAGLRLVASRSAHLEAA